MTGGRRKVERRIRRFVAEYLIDLNGSAAIVRAGFKGTRAKYAAKKLLAKPEVQALIQQAEDERAKATGISAEYVLRTIQETIERCRQAEPVLDNQGVPTGEWRFDSTAVLKGCELAGRHLGMWKDRVSINSTVEHRHIIEVPPVAASADEWQRQIRAEQTAGVLPGLPAKSH